MLNTWSIWPRLKLDLDLTACQIEKKILKSAISWSDRLDVRSFLHPMEVLSDVEASNTRKAIDDYWIIQSLLRSAILPTNVEAFIAEGGAFWIHDLWDSLLQVSDNLSLFLNLFWSFCLILYWPILLFFFFFSSSTTSTISWRRCVKLDESQGRLRRRMLRPPEGQMTSSSPNWKSRMRLALGNVS